MKTVTIYTDGACSGNPGPGGWGAILEYRGVEKEISGGEAMTTNNRMELTAVIRALELLREPCQVELWSDSKYVTDALTLGGRTLFDWFDFVTGQIFLPVVGFLTCIFIGWFVPHKIVHDEFTNWGTLRGRFFHLYIFLVKYVCPICILFIFLHQFGLI